MTIWRSLTKFGTDSPFLSAAAPPRVAALSFPRAASPTAPLSQRGIEHRKVTGRQGRKKRSRARVREGGGRRSHRPAPHPARAAPASLPQQPRLPQRDPRPQPGLAPRRCRGPAAAEGSPGWDGQGGSGGGSGGSGSGWGPRQPGRGFVGPGGPFPPRRPPRHGADSPGRARLWRGTGTGTGWARVGQEQPLPPHPCPVGRPEGSRGCGDADSNALGCRARGSAPHPPAPLLHLSARLAGTTPPVPPGKAAPYASSPSPRPSVPGRASGSGSPCSGFLRAARL